MAISERDRAIFKAEESTFGTDKGYPAMSLKKQAVQAWILNQLLVLDRNERAEEWRRPSEWSGGHWIKGSFAGVYGYVTAGVALLWVEELGFRLKKTHDAKIDGIRRGIYEAQLVRRELVIPDYIRFNAETGFYEPTEQPVYVTGYKVILRRGYIATGVFQGFPGRYTVPEVLVS